MKQKISLILILLISILVISFVSADSGAFTGGVGVIVRGSSANSTTNCGNNATSCGPQGYCMDLTGLTYCIDGYVYEMRCYANEPKKYRTTTTCRNIEVRFNVTDDDDSPNSVILKILTHSGTVLNSSSINGLGSLSLTDQNVDLDFEFDNSKFIFLAKDVDVNKIGSKINKLIVDKPNPNVPNFNVYKAYRVELPSDFNFSTILLKIKYSDVTVINESNITVYKCSSFNSLTNSCNGNWTKITPITIDVNNKIVSLEITSFSVYALGEQSATTTTTTITTTTTTTIPCSCDSWVNEGCGISSCLSYQMKQTRTCSPSNCDTQSRCISTTSCDYQQSSSQSESSSTPTTTATSNTADPTNQDPTIESTPQLETNVSELNNTDKKDTAFISLSKSNSLVAILIVGLFIGFFSPKLIKLQQIPKFHSKRIVYRKVHRKFDKIKKPRKIENFNTVLRL
jgi:hypothetical protein